LIPVLFQTIPFIQPKEKKELKKKEKKKKKTRKKERKEKKGNIYSFWFSNSHTIP
jgi:hypothetical protein